MARAYYIKFRFGRFGWPSAPKRAPAGRNGPWRRAALYEAPGARGFEQAGRRRLSGHGGQGRIPLKKGEDFGQKVSTYGKGPAEPGADCRKPEPELSDEETAEIRQRYSKPDPKTAAEYEKAKNEAEAASKRKWRKLFDAYQRCRELEKEHKLTTELSSTMLKSYLTGAALKKCGPKRTRYRHSENWMTH